MRTILGGVLSANAEKLRLRQIIPRKAREIQLNRSEVVMPSSLTFLSGLVDSREMRMLKELQPPFRIVGLKSHATRDLPQTCHGLINLRKRNEKMIVKRSGNNVTRNLAGG